MYIIIIVIIIIIIILIVITIQLPVVLNNHIGENYNTHTIKPDAIPTVGMHLRTFSIDD